MSAETRRYLDYVLYDSPELLKAILDEQRQIRALLNSLVKVHNSDTQRMNGTVATLEQIRDQFHAWTNQLSPIAPEGMKRKKRKRSR